MKKSIWDQKYIALRKELKKIRKEANLTQQELAVLLEKHQSHVAKYELGERNLDYIEVMTVCTICGIHPETFMSNFRKLIKSVN